MGALVPVHSWVPEDDLLLKNAIEAGASLESLAKGAVQFSRRFTVRELQDRWHSLLYDPVVSAEASLQVIELELAALLKLRFGNSKDNKHAGCKRNSDSVRSCYYAMRKRICNEPFGPMDLSFLLAYGDCRENGEEPVHGDFMCEDPRSNHLQLQGPDLDMVHGNFSQILTDGGIDTSGSGVVHAFHTELQNPIEGEYSIQQNNTHEDFCHILIEHMSLTGHCSEVEDLGEIKDLTMDSLLEVDDLGEQPSSSFEHMMNNQDHASSKFGGKQVFGKSYCNLEYSSPLPDMPMWTMDEGLSAPAMQVNVSLAEKDMCTGDTFALPDDRDPMDTTTSGYDVVNSDFNLKDEIICDVKLESPTAGTEGYLEELSNSLLTFTKEEELLFMVIDGKDAIDKSYYDGLSSLLLSSPADIDHDPMPNATELGTSGTPDAHLTNPLGISPAKLDTDTDHDYMPNTTELRTSGTPDKNPHGISPAKLDKVTDHDDMPNATELGTSGTLDMKPLGISPTMVEKDTEPQYGDGDVYRNSETQTISSAPASNLGLPKLCEEFVLCTLNTEDSEIPCNDDVFLPDEVPSLAEPVNFRETDHRSHSSVMNLLVNQKTLDRGTGMQQRELKDAGQSHISSQLIGPRVLPGMGLYCASRKDEVCGDALLPVMLKDETTAIALPMRLGHTMQNCTLPKWELDGQDTIQNIQTLHDSAVSEPLLNPSLSDQDELTIESDDDVPNFSDIEAMILDRDLTPNDQDLHSSAAVARYQHEEFKRSIIRLEQGAHSYMQRAIASHGAFAVLYGLHSKHYIRKPHVLIGRDTNVRIVDIDLQCEGRANKASRRQAIIKMNESGSFSIKNVGKFPIWVNDMEATRKESLTLESNSLIELRGMYFIFETNQTYINRFLVRMAKDNKTIQHQD